MCPFSTLKYHTFSAILESMEAPMRTVSLFVSSGLALAMILSPGGCDCDGAVAPNGTSGDAVNTASLDASASTLDARVPLDDAGHPIIPDGSAVAYDDAGNLVFVDASTSDANSSIADAASAEDANALEQPLPDFCQGSGAVVSFGEEGICSGDLAAETFRFGLCACDSVYTNAQLRIDAFDSSLGAYGDQTPSDDGNLGVNNGPLDLAGKLTVRGSSFVGGGGMSLTHNSQVTQNLSAYGDLSGQASIGRNAYINGDLASGISIGGDLYQPAGATSSGTVNGSIIHQVIPNILPCPCSEEQILDVAALTSWAQTHNDNDLFGESAGGAAAVLDPNLFASGGPAELHLPCGRYYLSTVEQGGGLTLFVEGRAVLFIDGNLNAGPFAIQVADGAEIDLFVARDVNITASANFGSAEKPSLVRTYIGGTVSLAASANFAGNIYAPHADIDFGAHGEVYGSLMVNSVSFNAAADIHFDRAIRRASESCVNPNPADGGSLVDSGAVGDAALADLVGVDQYVSLPDAAGHDSMQPDAAQPNTCSAVCSFECGYEACLIDGQGEGHCGPCQSDLDCCAPMLCDTNSGACYYPGG